MNIEEIKINKIPSKIKSIYKIDNEEVNIDVLELVFVTSKRKIASGCFLDNIDKTDWEKLETSLLGQSIIDAFEIDLKYSPLDNKYSSLKINVPINIWELVENKAEFRVIDINNEEIIIESLEKIKTTSIDTKYDPTYGIISSIWLPYLKIIEKKKEE